MLISLLLAMPLIAPAAVVGPGIPSSSSVSIPARVPGSDAEEVSILTHDKVKLAGDYYAPRSKNKRAPAALLVHDAGADRKQCTKIAERMRMEGFGVLVLDLRGHGGSPLGKIPWKELDEEQQFKLWSFAKRDLDAGANWLRERKELHATNLSLVGVGAGAALAAKHARSNGNVRAVVLVSPSSQTFGFDLEGDLAELEGLPTYIVAAKKDRDQAEGIMTRAQNGTSVAWIELEVMSRGKHALDDKGLPKDIAKWVGNQAQPKRGSAYTTATRGR